jgi:phage-related protein
MGSEFTFYDFVERTNLIHDWLDTLPVPVKVKFNKRLLHLEALGPGQWRRPFVDHVREGLFEIRASQNHIQYRLLGCHGPGDRRPTLLHGFIKPGRKVLDTDCTIALARMALVHADADSYREEHRYD